MTETAPTYQAGQTFGRPRLSDAPLKTVAVRLTAAQVEYLEQHGGRTEAIRNLIDQAIVEAEPDK